MPRTTKNPRTLSPRLAGTALQPLPLGSIRPAGWLRQQLQLQADGLSGHLDEFWPAVARSAWIGGDAEGWERGPYWLDGVVPLAFLLDDAHLKDKVRRWVDYILSHQHADGWLGPVVDDHEGFGETRLDPWPLFVVLKALTQYQEATGDERIIPAMEHLLHRVDTLLDEKPLASWAKMRWPDFVLSIHWLYQHSGDAWLLALAHKVQQQGYNWRAHGASFPFRDKQQRWMLENHVVNHAMALKEPAVAYRQAADRHSAATLATQYIELLDAYHGQATGVFTGDESLAGMSPSQGTELCAVVEYMFSLEVLLAAFGDTAFADRLERIAFNALPATFKPDMWAHQYVQQANQVICCIGDEVIYTNNGPDANIFGLEPNFGCCTANMHQGWPKFTTRLWMHAPDGGLTALAYAPCEVETEVHGHSVRIDVLTNYPFESLVMCRVVAEQDVQFPLRLRIPGWAAGAEVIVGDEPGVPVLPGTFHCLDRRWSGETVVQLRLPMPVTIQSRFNGSVTIERGPLVYALNIDETWKQVRGQLPHADWEVYPTGSWNYALAIDRDHPENSLRFEESAPGDCPFSPDGVPVRARVKGRRVPTWGLERNAAAPPPLSPVASSEPLEELTLIPYGCTNLRVTEIPVLD